MLHSLRRTPLLRGLPPEVAVVAAIAFCVALGFGIVAPAIPIYATSFGVSALAAGAVVSVFAAMRFLSAPPAGALVSRLGERHVLTSGLLIVSISSVFAGLAQDYPQLLVLRGLGGIGSTMFTVSALALLMKVSEQNQRGRAAGAFQAGFILGGVAGPAVGGLVLDISVRAPFFVYAATLLLAAAVSWTMLRETDAGRPAPYPDPRAPASDGETPGDVDPPPTLARALRMRPYWAALTANLTNGFVTFGLRFSLVPLFVIEGLGEGGTLTGVGFLVAAGTQAAMLLPAGRMADTRGRRPALLIGGALTVIGMAALMLASAPAPFLLAMAIAGLATAFMGSAPAATAGDIAGRSGQGQVIAVYQMTADLGAVVGPVLAGWLADQYGYGPAFAAGAAVALIALIAASAMNETLQRQD